MTADSGPIGTAVDVQNFLSSHTTDGSQAAKWDSW